MDSGVNGAWTTVSHNINACIGADLAEYVYLIGICIQTTVYVVLSEYFACSLVCKNLQFTIKRGIQNPV